MAEEKLKSGKIELKYYQEKWRVECRKQLQLDEDFLDECFQILEKIAGSHLLCSLCKSIKPDDEFYKASRQYTRRLRSTICKSCYPKYLQRKRYEDPE